MFQKIIINFTETDIFPKTDIFPRWERYDGPNSILMFSRIFVNSSISISYVLKSSSVCKRVVFRVDSKNDMIGINMVSPILLVFNGTKILKGYCWPETVISLFSKESHPILTSTLSVFPVLFIVRIECRDPKCVVVSSMKTEKLKIQFRVPSQVQSWYIRNKWFVKFN